MNIQRIPNNVIFSYLNINSIRNKFHNLKLKIDEHVDILCVLETKIGNSFPTTQFSWPGYHKPYCLIISDRRGGLLVYIKSHLPSRRLTNYIIPKDIQIIPSELNLRKEKWMFICIYRPPSQNKQYFLENLSMITDQYSSIYDNHIILGDFNMEQNSPILISFMQSLNLFIIIKSNTCFKGNGTCIDLIQITNRKYCFKHSFTFETGLSNHDHLIYSMLKTTFKKEEPKLYKYRDYKKFDSTGFHTDLQSKLEEGTTKGRRKFWRDFCKSFRCSCTKKS